MKKKLLLFGNKPLDKELSQEQIDHINSFDVIMRVNKFDNILDTGCRIDWIWVTCGSFWDIDFLKSGQPEIFNIKYNSNIHKQISKMFLDQDTVRYLKQYLGEYFTNCPTDEKIILNIFRIIFNQLDEQIDVNIVENYHTSIWKHFNLEIDKTIPHCNPVSSVLCLVYLIKEYSEEYDIYFACLDIEGRDVLLKTNPIWCNNVHRNVGAFETNFLQKMIKENKLHYIDLYA